MLPLRQHQHQAVATSEGIKGWWMDNTDGWDAGKVTEFGQPHARIRSVMDGGWEDIVKDDLARYVEG